MKRVYNDAVYNDNPTYSDIFWTLGDYLKINFWLIMIQPHAS